MLCALAQALVLPAAAGAATPALAAASADTRDLTTYVNPLSGTLGAGFPMVGASLPFGMIQQGPDTGHPGTADPVNYDGYAYGDTQVRGFSLAHFDGAGIHISGDLPFMPTTGAVSSSDYTRYQSTFSHTNEVSVPGYYAVDLGTYQTRVELASGVHSGIQRYTFPSTTQANVLFNASLSIDGLHPASVDIFGNNTLRGSMASTAKKGEGYTLYYYAVFDRPFNAFGTWSGSTFTPGSRNTSGSSNGAYLTFDTTVNPAVNVRIGISYVDLAGALNNLDSEIPEGTSLDTLRAAAHDSWNSRLHGLEVESTDTGLLQTFYTNLYRSLTMPSQFDDVDGRYMGFDRVAHRVPGGQHHYTNLSLWDTYRTQNPLLELIEPKVAHDIYVSLLDDYDQNGQVLPKWVDANLDYQIMGGDSATPTIADGVMRGLLTGGEVQRAYLALRHQALTVTPGMGGPREHLDQDVAHGYIPYENAGNRAAAETQEYAIADASLYQLATRLNDPTTATTLRARADYWKNLIDPGQKFTRPRNGDGTWSDPCSNNPFGGPCAGHPWDPRFEDGYQEATGWQQTWLEQHDVAAMTTAIGGRDATLARLDTFFSTALTDGPYAVPLTQQYSSIFGIYYIGNQFTPANEPDLHTPWYYDYLGQPYKAQKVVRAAMQTYSQRPDGLPGNDDTGTMSSWYVLAALGIYSVTPGVPVWELNSPSFEVERIHMGATRGTFTISAPGASTVNKYVQSATLNPQASATRATGTTFDRPYLTQCEMVGGGELKYVLGPTANTTWGAGATPPSLSDSVPNGEAADCATALVAASLVTPPDMPDGPATGLLAAGALAMLVVGLSRRRARRQRRLSAIPAGNAG
ncbi:MAG: GH92 family glycosyl hydrolase [Candidatus Dormibacteria bacterium]